MIVVDGVFALSPAEATALLTFTHRGQLMSISALMLDPQAACAIAADGHRMLVARSGGQCPLDIASTSGQAGPGTRLLPRAELKKATAELRAQDTLVIDTTDGSVGKLCRGPGPRSSRDAMLSSRSNVRTACALEGGSIIPWPQVLAYSCADVQAPGPIALPGDYVADFAQLPRRLGPTRRPSQVPPTITIKTHGPMAPVMMRWVDASRATTWVGVLMPVGERA